MLFINFKKLRPEARMPTKAFPSDAGYDLFTPERLEFVPGERKLIKLGFSIEIPDGWYAQMKTKSGLAGKGFSVTAGVMDSSYRGEYMVYVDWEPAKIDLRKDWDERYTYLFNPGDKVAQMVFLPVPHVSIAEVYELTETERGSGAFGSTGK